MVRQLEQKPVGKYMPRGDFIKNDNNLDQFLELAEEWENGDTAEAAEKLDREFFPDEICFEIIKKIHSHPIGKEKVER